jgi:hypothetical protein
MGELLLGLDFLGNVAPSEPDRINEASRTSSSSRCLRSSGDPGAELEWTSSACGRVGLRLGLEDAAHVEIGDICAFEDRRRRLSMSSSTILMRRSAGSSTPARFTVRDLSCSARRSQPKNCRMSMSLISKALKFLNAMRGTAVSNGNSSYPSISLIFLSSGASLKHGILVNAEYKYFKSVSVAAFCFSVRAAELLVPSPKFDHKDDIPDITLRTLDTEWIDPWSEPARPLGRCDWLKNET